MRHCKPPHSSTVLTDVGHMFSFLMKITLEARIVDEHLRDRVVVKMTQAPGEADHYLASLHLQGHTPNTKIILVSGDSDMIVQWRSCTSTIVSVGGMRFTPFANSEEILREKLKNTKINTTFKLTTTPVQSSERIFFEICTTAMGDDYGHAKVRSFGSKKCISLLQEIRDLITVGGVEKLALLDSHATCIENHLANISSGDSLFRLEALDSPELPSVVETMMSLLDVDLEYFFSVISECRGGALLMRQKKELKKSFCSNRVAELHAQQKAETTVVDPASDPKYAQLIPKLLVPYAGE